VRCGKSALSQFAGVFLLGSTRLSRTALNRLPKTTRSDPQTPPVHTQTRSATNTTPEATWTATLTRLAMPRSTATTNLAGPGPIKAAKRVSCHWRGYWCCGTQRSRPPESEHASARERFCRGFLEPVWQGLGGEAALAAAQRMQVGSKKTKGLARAIVLTLVFFGAAGRNRTHDPLVRSQVLYPAELQPRSLAF
jgi:hypothetical protein